MSDNTTALAAAQTKLPKPEDYMMEKFVPGITGILKLGRPEFIQVLSNIVQRQRKEGWLGALLIELNQLCEEGKVKEGYIRSEQGQECRQELLDSLDKDKPDMGKFEAMKTIFLKAAMAPESEWESKRPQQLMRRCRTLEAEELIILGVSYQLFSTLSAGELERGCGAADKWPSFIAQHSNGQISEGIVSYYEQDLMNKQLIGGRNHSDRSGVIHAQKCRLAPLGIELSQFLAE